MCMQQQRQQQQRQQQFIANNIDTTKTVYARNICQCVILTLLSHLFTLYFVCVWVHVVVVLVALLQ